MTLWTIAPLTVIAVVLTLLWFRRWCLLWIQRGRHWCCIRIRRGHTFAWLMWNLFPYARVSVCHAAMTDEKWIAAHKHVKRGHVVATTDKRSLAAILVPGEWTHILLCIGEIDGIMMCAEMTHGGWGLIPFGLAISRASRVGIGDPEWEDAYVDAVIDESMSLEGSDYDTQYVIGNEEISCAELPCVADFEHRLKVIPSKIWWTGQLAITPDDVMAATKLIYKSDQPREPRLITAMKVAGWCFPKTVWLITWLLKPTKRKEADHDAIPKEANHNRSVSDDEGTEV